MAKNEPRLNSVVIMKLSPLNYFSLLFISLKIVGL